MDYEQEVFVEKLNEKMNKKSEEFGFTIQSGVPFEMVIADEIREFESGAWDADETDNSVGDWGKSKDLECDLWFENEEIQTIKIVQAKHSKSYESDTSPDDLKRFFTTWRRLLDPDVVENEANENLQNRLNGFEEKINDGWTVEFQFITTKKVSLNREGKVRKYELEAHKDGYENFSFTTMGLVDFHEYCAIAESMTKDIPESIELEFDSKKLLITQSSTGKYALGVISGEQLHDLYYKHGAALFNSNVREGLQQSKKNAAIRKTIIIEEEGRKPEKNIAEQKYFFYYNNGITALCEHLESSKSIVTAEKLQIINGAQTTTSIAKAIKTAKKHGVDTDEIEVLIRILEVESIAGDSTQADKIIEYTNTQNEIKQYDFRANDPLQRQCLAKDLEMKVGNYRFWYRPKRGSKKPQDKVGKELKLQDFTKMRQAYLHDPTDLFNDVPKLWSLESDGRYKQAFGIGNNELVNAWKDEYIKEGIFIVCLTKRIEEILKTKKVSSGLSLTQMRFHILHLAGRELGLKGKSGRKKIPHYLNHGDESGRKDFEDLVDPAINKAVRAVNSEWRVVQRGNNPPTAFKFKQYPSYWSDIQSHFDDLD